MIVKAALRRDSIIQVRTVVLVASLAVSRKVVILDSSAPPASPIAALVAVTFVLGAIYWFWLLTGQATFG